MSRDDLHMMIAVGAVPAHRTEMGSGSRCGTNGDDDAGAREHQGRKPSQRTDALSPSRP